MNKPLNMIISGLGGQGVFVLTKTFFQLCAMKDFKCQSSTFKGGAQKHGSIHSVLRIFAEDSQDYHMYSTQILPGELDVIIGMEPWETLRYHAYFSKKTHIFMNSVITPFYQERMQNLTDINPVQTVKDLNLPGVTRDYTAEALHTFGSGKMLNFVMGMDAASSTALPFTTDAFMSAFLSQVRIDEEIRSKMLTRYDH